MLGMLHIPTDFLTICFFHFIAFAQNILDWLRQKKHYKPQDRVSLFYKLCDQNVILAVQIAIFFSTMLTLIVFIRW